MRRTCKPRDGSAALVRRAVHPLFLGLAVLLAPARARAQTAIEVRAGLIASSALVEDAVANDPLRRQLGPAFLGNVRATPAPAPIVVLALVTPLRTRTALEFSAGWAFSRLDAEDASGTRELHDLGIGHVTVALRYQLHVRLDAGCGFGVARYFADEAGLFATGSELTPQLECSTGGRIGTGARSIVLRLTGQAQRFRTPALRDAGAQTGTILRLSVQAGIALRKRP